MARKHREKDISKQKKRDIYEHLYKKLALAAFLLLVTGTVVYRYLEDWSWVDSLYFSVVAVTTVGFGDLAPSTDGAKLFTVVYLLAGVTIITAYLNNRFKYRAYERMDSGDPVNLPDSPDVGDGS